MYRSWIELSRSALLHNLASYKAFLPEGCDVMAVVKADAYGHGAATVAPELEAAGIRHFAVASMEEGVALRQSGVNAPILILGYTDPAQTSRLLCYELTQTVTCAEYEEQLAECSRRLGRRVKVHIAVDTGMHRLGFDPEDFPLLLHCCRDARLQVTGIYSHLCVADSTEECDVSFSQQQIDRFDRCIAALRKNSACPPVVHLLASYAAVNYPKPGYDYARLGILLFGIRSSDTDYLKPKLDLRPVMQLKARVTSVRRIEPGEGVSYGLVYHASRPTTVASVSIGYADGLPRCLSGKMRAIVRGQYAQQIGRICMDQLMLDVTDIPNVHTGDVVILIGHDGACQIRAEELAQNAGTITNELLSRLGRRLEGRCFVPQGASAETFWGKEEEIWKNKWNA